MRLRVFLYRQRGLLGVLVVLLLLGAAASLVGPAFQATGFGDLVRLGSGTAMDAVVAAPAPNYPAANQPVVAPSAIAHSEDGASTADPARTLPVRATDLDHPTVPTSAVVTAFNCARQRAGLAPYVVDAQLTAEANTVATRIQAGGHGPKPGEQRWTLTGTLVLDTTAATQDCMVGGVDLSDVPDLDRASSIGVVIVPLPEPQLVLAVIVGR